MPPKGKKGSSSSSSGHQRSIISIDPSTVYFTHARVRPFFTGCNKRIDETLQEIISGATDIKKIPKITVLHNQGHLFSLNNRRLYLFKELHDRGLLPTVEVQLKEATDKEKARYTPERCVLRARIMKESSREGKEEEGAGSGSEEEERDEKELEDGAGSQG